MTEVDLSRLPKGELGWAALVEYVATADDRVERYFLEAKSDVDLTTAAGRAKVAKFILGSANRDPGRAARRFEGHGIMLLGVGRGGATGIPPFEAHKLARAITRWIGSDGPRWDFERFPTDNDDDNDVIAIVVDPPTGEMWTCLADGDGLNDGDIYIRGDGDTRKATGDEIRAMIKRASSSTLGIDVDVDVSGTIVAIGVDVEPIADRIKGLANGLRLQLATTRVKSFLPSMATERRSEEEFLREIETWHTKASADPLYGVAEIAGCLLPGIRVRAINNGKAFLHEVRIDIEFDDENVRAVDWLDPDLADSMSLTPHVPQDWGTKTWDLGLLSSSRSMPVPQPGSHHGIVEITRDSPARLTMHLDPLRPEEPFVSDDDDVVLIMFTDSPPESISGRWRMTADGINDVFRGEFVVPTEYRDWHKPVREVLTAAVEDSPEPGSAS